MSSRIVFDLDGTLIDSAPDLHAIANALLAEEGATPISLDHAREFIGNGASVFVQKMRAAGSIPDSEHARVLAAFTERYSDAVTLTQLYPGVRDALDRLHREGHGLGICTNKPIRPCRAVLRHFGLDHYFTVVVGGDSLPVYKPDPAPLNAAFEALPEGPEVYVGDSEVDAETAHHAKVPFLLFSEGYRKCPVERLAHSAAFRAFAELPGLVERICSE